MSRKCLLRHLTPYCHRTINCLRLPLTVTSRRKRQLLCLTYLKK